MRMAVLDTETTGLPLNDQADLRLQPYIIEWAVAHIVNGKVAATYETLIKPPIPLPAEITKITGLTDEDLVDAPNFSGALPLIMKSLEGVDIVVAHNAPFDVGMLEFELARHGINFVWPRVECSVQLYHDEYGRRMKLLELYEAKLGKPLDQTHRALDDVMALCEIIINEKLWKVL